MAERKKDDAVFTALKRAFAIVNAIGNAIAIDDEEVELEKVNELIVEIRKQLTAFCGELDDQDVRNIANVYAAANLNPKCGDKYSAWTLSNVCNAGLALRMAEADVAAAIGEDGEPTVRQSRRLKMLRAKLVQHLGNAEGQLKKVDSDFFYY